MPPDKMQSLGKINDRRGTMVRFKPDPQIFGKAVEFSAARLFRMARSKAYLFGGVEIRWHCDPSHIKDKDKRPEKAVLHFPGGLKDFLEERLEGKTRVVDEIFAGKIDKARRPRHCRMGHRLVRRR